MTDDNPNMESLNRWFSPARMARYGNTPDPSALYVWDGRLAKAYLEDVAHVEVLLRNFVAVRLEADCMRRTSGACRCWFDRPDIYNLNEVQLGSVAKAKSRLSHQGKTATYDQVVASLPMDFWRFLLAKRLEPTIWRALRDKANGGMPHHPRTSRADFERHFLTIYSLRNRCSHQEHLVMSNIDKERARLDVYSADILWVASRIDPDAAQWINENSRVSVVREQRPI